MTLPPHYKTCCRCGVSKHRLLPQWSRNVRRTLSCTCLVNWLERISSGETEHTLQCGWGEDGRSTSSAAAMSAIEADKRARVVGDRLHAKFLPARANPAERASVRAARRRVIMLRDEGVPGSRATAPMGAAPVCQRGGLRGGR